MKSRPCTGLDRTLGLQKVEAPRISRQSALQTAKVVSPTQPPPLPAPQEDIATQPTRQPHAIHEMGWWYQAETITPVYV
jgi:hypothetical protein